MIAAKYAGAQINLEKPNESGAVPTLKTGDGKSLNGSSNILSHVAGKDNKEVLDWIHLSEQNFAPAVGSWVYPTLSFMPYNKATVDQARDEVLHLLKLLDGYLLTRTYLVGEKITAADVAVSCSLLLAYQHVLEPSVRSPFVNVNRWFNTLVHQAHFKAVLGEVNLCEKAAQPQTAGKQTIPEILEIPPTPRNKTVSTSSAVSVESDSTGAPGASGKNKKKKGKTAWQFAACLPYFYLTT